MRVKVTAEVYYEIEDASLMEAYGTEDPDEVVAQEAVLLDESGDYIIFLVTSAEKMTTSVERLE